MENLESKVSYGGTITSEQHIWLNGIKEYIRDCQKKLEKGSESQNPQFIMGQIHEKMLQINRALEMITTDLVQQNEKAKEIKAD
jgi:hypothetical protein